ncbi:MAG: thermonuclease family protein [Alphaproteobacteria bacterium]|nr:thermonuclease family protein [Alphaproteobacteria bacterium]
MRAWTGVVIAVALAACGPKIEDLEKGEKGTAAEVRDGDTFVMDSGLVVHLAGVEAPGFEQPLAKDARGALERLVAHRKVQLAYGGEKRAREAALAQVYVQTEGGRWVWAQQALLLEGHARVHTRRDNVARLAELTAAEDAARTAKRGVWADPFYALRSPADLARSLDEVKADPACAAELAQIAERREARKKAEDAPVTGRPTTPPPEAAKSEDAVATDEPRRPRRRRDLTIVEGQITSVADRERAVFLNFGDDIARDFGVMIGKDNLANFPGGVEALTALQGKTVRVRGTVPRCAKPLMRIDHAAQLLVVK